MGEQNAAQVKKGLANMLKGGVIIDVTSPEEAVIAEAAGAVAVMAFDKSPYDKQNEGGVSRMTSPDLIIKIMEAVSIPVVVAARIGHFAEAQILEALGVDYIDESEVLTPADEVFHINKHEFTVPYVCGARNLSEALRRIGEGAAMIRTMGEAGRGNVAGAVRHMRQIMSDIRRVQNTPDEELMTEAKNLGAPYELVSEVKRLGKLPVVNFAAGGIVTPADAALMMQLGCDGVFVGGALFKAKNPRARAHAIVEAVEHYNNPLKLAELFKNLAE